MSHAETRTQRLAAMRGIHIDRLGGPQQITEDREHVLVAFLLPEVLARLRDLPPPACPAGNSPAAVVCSRI